MPQYVIQFLTTDKSSVIEHLEREAEDDANAIANAVHMGPPADGHVLRVFRGELMLYEGRC